MDNSTVHDAVCTRPHHIFLSFDQENIAVALHSLSQVFDVDSAQYFPLPNAEFLQHNYHSAPVIQESKVPLSLVFSQTAPFNLVCRSSALWMAGAS